MEKIAIIGSGISGLTAAYHLNPTADITVFEKNDYIGGHTATKMINLQGIEYAVDTGFIVFNDRTYPRFTALLDATGVKSKDTTMGFSVSCPERSFEYAGTNFNTLFAQRKNLFSPRFYGMLKDIARFNNLAQKHYSSGLLDPEMSLDDYLLENRFGELFKKNYIYPMASAIWSASIDNVRQFNALFFIRFFVNHGLLSISDRPQWKVIQGGSKSYIPALTRGFEDKIKLNSHITGIRRFAHGVELHFENSSQMFDHVVFACHSDQALSLLKDPSKEEIDILKSIPYQDNTVTLHTDSSLLPDRKLAWSSWNYRLGESDDELPLLTYNMNMLQGLDSPETICVTVNGSNQIERSKIISEYTYAHPVFGASSVAAQNSWQQINGQHRTWFCGAYWGNGFHEDGVVSAERVAGEIKAQQVEQRFAA